MNRMPGKGGSSKGDFTRGRGSEPRESPQHEAIFKSSEFPSRLAILFFERWTSPTAMGRFTSPTAKLTKYLSVFTSHKQTLLTRLWALTPCRQTFRNQMSIFPTDPWTFPSHPETFIFYHW